MASQKSASFKHVKLIPKDRENKYLHKGMIAVSFSILMLLKGLKKLGSTVQYLRHIFCRNKERFTDKNVISIIGNIDTRMELNKAIKHGDARYYPALSMMASKLAYENERVIDSTVSHRWMMEFVKFYNCYNGYLQKSTTQAFIMREKTAEDDKIIVAFRGTEPFDADDWSTDFDFSWCKIDGVGKTHLGYMIAMGLKKFDHVIGDEDYTCEFPKQIEQGDPEKPLAYYSIRDKLKEITANNKRAKFIVTGHSLGGALAVLFPALLAYHGEVELLNKLETIYTYGQPRVGNENFGRFVKKKLREHNIKYYRIVYGYDVVPEVPLNSILMSFKHFGTCIRFNSLYHGKIVDEEPKQSLVVKMLMEFVPARLSAIWELIRGLIIGYTAGPYYREGWLLICLRCFGILTPGFVNHNPQDYVNSTMLASEDLFKYYPALTT